MRFSRERRANPRSGLRRMTALTVGALFAALLLAVALIFSSAAGAARIAEASRSLNWTNTVAAAAGITRAATAQAVVFSIDRGLGVASDAAVDSALAEAQENLDVMREWVAEAPGEIDDAVLTEVAEFDNAVTAVLALVEQNRPVAADRALGNQLEAAFDGAIEDLSATQQTLAAEISGAEATAGRVAITTRTLVSLLIPVAAILIYRAMAKSELKRRRSEMMARVEAAEELSRAKDEFIAGISHELRTPLTSIYGFSQYLLDNGIIDPTETRELIELINKDSAELSRMVEDLLTAARLDANSLDFSPSAVAMLSELHTVVTPLLRAGHDVTVRGNHVVVWADRVRVRQILRNLISNAIKHGGPRIEVTVKTVGDEMHATIADSGMGVSPDIEPRMFDRFVHDGQASLLTGSVGLGLAISKSLAQHMGGDLLYDRSQGWTRFTLELPLAPDHAHPPLEPELEDFDNVKPVSLSTRVLLADLTDDGMAESRMASDVRIRFDD